MRDAYVDGVASSFSAMGFSAGSGVVIDDRCFVKDRVVQTSLIQTSPL
jgi:hypothetical protein